MSELSASNAGPTELVHVAVPALEEVPSATDFGEVSYFPDLGHYIEVARALKDAGFETCSDITCVDYLSPKQARTLPGGVVPERFELVVQLLSLEHVKRVRLRVQVSEHDPSVPTLFFVYPGTENMEREIYDMFGLSFENHPDMTRILMPEDWEGHPLRKDYGIGRVPVQFKEAPGPR